MTYDLSVVSVIEAAIDQNPYCTACGAHNVVRTEGSIVLIECADADTPRSTIRRFIHALLPHERQVIVS